MSVSELVRGQLRHYVTDRPTYTLTGSGPSMLRDWWVSNHPAEGDAYEAGQRLESHKRFMRQMQATFATATRATDPEIIPRVTGRCWPTSNPIGRCTTPLRMAT
jgi:hypothetical protein